MSPPSPDMTAADVVAFLRVVEDIGASIWVDGGWAVDANLGEQTRKHGDLDIVIEDHHVDRLLSALSERGFAPVEQDDTTEWNFVVGDDDGHLVDFHVITISAEGRGLYGPQDENGESYPAEALRGVGVIAGHSVACIAPEVLVEFHTGYELRDTDWADVEALCERFDLPIPDEYDRFR